MDLFPNKQNQQFNKEMAIQEQSIDAQREGNVMAASQSDYAEVQAQEAKSDLIRWQQEMETELFELCLSFLALRKEQENIVKIKGAKPLCNMLFIHQVVVPTLKPFMSKNLINSKYDTTRILKKLLFTSNDIASRMAEGWMGEHNEYAIQFRDQDMILRSMKNYMEDASNRAVNGWTKKTDSEHSKVITAHVDNGSKVPAKKGFLGLGR